MTGELTACPGCGGRLRLIALALAADVPSEIFVTNRPTNNGSGRAYGLDLFASRAASGTGGLSGWVSYSWSHAERTEYGLTRPFAYDRRHSLNLVSEYRFGSRWSLAATLKAGSGFPRTRAAGVRVSGAKDRLDADNDGVVDEIVPERDAQGRLVYEVDFGGPTNANQARLPWVARLDLRATWRPRWTRGRGELYLDLINATNRKNAFSIESRLEFDPLGIKPRVVETREDAIPLLPSIGIRWRF